MDKKDSNSKSTFSRDDRGGSSFFRARRDRDGVSNNNHNDSGDSRESRPRSGGDRDSKPRFGGDREFKPRFGGDRNSKPRFGGDRDSKPRFGGDRDSKPRFGGSSDREFKPRFDSDKPRFGGDRDSKPRFGGDRDREFKPRFDSDKPRFGGDRDSKPRFGGDRDREFKPRFDSDKPRFGGDRDSKPRFGGDRDSKPRFGGDRDREFKPRFGGSSDRDSKPRFDSDKPRFGGDRDSKPRFGGDRDSKPRFGGDREFKPRFDSDKPRFGSDKPRFDGNKPRLGSDKPRFSKDSKPKFSTGRDRKSKYEESISDAPSEMRLNRFIAMSGVCSRREADTLIIAGEVTVNGVMVDVLGTKVNTTDDIRLNGERLQGEKKVYIIVNKPKDYVTTVEDPHADRTVMDLLKGEVSERIYPVGRLDRNTTGVLLLTNDGALTKELTHPSYEKKKIYHVFLNKPCTDEDLQKLASGIELEDGPVHADEVSFVENNPTEVGIELHSGRNRIVRRMFESMGYEVVKLDRVFFAGMTKMGLRRGFWRHLTPREISALKSGSYE